MSAPRTVQAYPCSQIKRRLGLDERPLDPFARAVRPAWSKNPVVGLTGATGWLGRHLARRLLASDPDLYLVVPVRATSQDQAMARLQRAWCITPQALRQAHDEHWWERTLPLPIASLDASWEALPFARRLMDLDVVVHGAADMSLALSLDGAWAPNVLATQNAYRWASLWGARRFDHISTLSVFIAGTTPPGVIHEDDPLERAGTLHGGYAASKWAAEAWLSTQKDLGVAVHRLGLISYSNTDGWAPGDGLHAAALAWKKWGCPDFLDPKVDQAVDFSPVDKAAQGIHRAIVEGHLGALHWASRLAVPATVWTRLWHQRFGSAPGDWPASDPLGKQARRALGRWADPRRASTFWWHDVFQSGPYRYDARHASELLPQWSWSKGDLEQALDFIRE